MPAVSQAQNRFIHAKAREGVRWARKFLADSEGEPIPNVERVRPRSRQKVRTRRGR